MTISGVDAAIERRPPDEREKIFKRIMLQEFTQMPTDALLNVLTNEWMNIAEIITKLKIKDMKLSQDPRTGISISNEYSF